METMRFHRLIEEQNPDLLSKAGVFQKLLVALEGFGFWGSK